MDTTRYSSGGMVASADHLASQAGASALSRGGSAADAAIATNAVLAVTAPHLCGLGGDLFALVHDGGEVHTAYAAGRAGSGADAAALRAEGHTRMPLLGDVRSVTVPGCVDGWLLLHERFGRLSLGDLLGPAARIADEGFGTSPLLASGAGRLTGVRGAEDFEAATTAGARMRRPGVARTLRTIVDQGREGFYLGEFGEGVLEVGGGQFTEDDLRTPQAVWEPALRVRAFGHDVWSTPPSTQGYLLLLGLAVADGLDLPDSPGDAAWAHLLAEAARVAAYDREAVLHDGATGLLDEAEVLRRRAMVDPGRAATVPPPTRDGDTTYLCVVDGEGMGVSLIQSNALGFGSQVFEPSTGIGLHNRGIGFSLEEGHPAELGPGRRPPHTLTPALVTRPDGGLRAVLGTMGGDAQPQVVLQLAVRVLAQDEPVGVAVDARRWRWGNEGSGFDTWADPAQVRLELETGAPPAWRTGLEQRGHRVGEVAFGGAFGHAHAIEVRPDGLRGGAADPRTVIGAVATAPR